MELCVALLFKRFFLFWKRIKFRFSNHNWIYQRDTLKWNSMRQNISYFFSHTQKRNTMTWWSHQNTIGICAVILCYFDGVWLLFLFSTSLSYLFLLLFLEQIFGFFRHSHKMRQMHLLVLFLVEMTTIQRQIKNKVIIGTSSIYTKTLQFEQFKWSLKTLFVNRHLNQQQ